MIQLISVLSLCTGVLLMWISPVWMVAVALVWFFLVFGAAWGLDRMVEERRIEILRANNQDRVNRSFNRDQ